MQGEKGNVFLSGRGLVLPLYLNTAGLASGAREKVLKFAPIKPGIVGAAFLNLGAQVRGGGMFLKSNPILPGRPPFAARRKQRRNIIRHRQHPPPVKSHPFAGRDFRKTKFLPANPLNRIAPNSRNDTAHSAAIIKQPLPYPRHSRAGGNPAITCYCASAQSN